MTFVGLMDGSKAIQYYDAKHRSIKVSQNVAFNENEEPRKLEIVEVPGVQVEGEIKVGATRNQPHYVIVLYKRQEAQNVGLEKKKKKKTARIESK